MVTLLDGNLYQWDTGRVVQIDPDTDYVIHEVHFATRKMDFAYVVKTYTENGKTYCKIPNILLQQYYDIYCYEVRENDDGEETTSTTIFKVTKRSRPLDYIYTDPEKYTYKELENRLKVIEDSLDDIKAATDEAGLLANESYIAAESAMSKANESYSMAESIKTKSDEAYAMAESAKSTVETFDDRITTLEEQPSTSNNVVEF